MKIHQSYTVHPPSWLACDFSFWLEENLRSWMSSVKRRNRALLLSNRPRLTDFPFSPFIRCCSQIRAKLTARVGVCEALFASSVYPCGLAKAKLVAWTILESIENARLRFPPRCHIPGTSRADR